MRTQGKFVLCTTEEFDVWLGKASVSRVVTLVQNHHTLEPAYGDFRQDNHFSLLEAMENYHVKERGFDMIAQNLTTFPDGTVAVCRPLDRIPAGIKGANQGGVCIENLGDFDAGRDKMTKEQRNAIVAVNTSLCRRFKLTPSTDTIVYHHWFDLDTGTRTDGTGNVKTCPGTAFFGGNTVADAAANFVSLIGQPTAPGTAAVPGTVAEVVADLLNVRSGANDTCPIVKQLAKGVTVQVYEELDGWGRIAPDRQEWVNETYLQFA